MTGVTINPGALTSLTLSDVKALHDYAETKSKVYRKDLTQSSIDLAIKWESLRNILDEKLMEAIQFITNNDKLV